MEFQLVLVRHGYSLGNEKSLLSMVAIPVKPPFIMPFGARKLFTDTAYKMPPPKK